MGIHLQTRGQATPRVGTQIPPRMLIPKVILQKFYFKDSNQHELIFEAATLEQILVPPCSGFPLLSLFYLTRLDLGNLGKKVPSTAKAMLNSCNQFLGIHLWCYLPPEKDSFTKGQAETDWKERPTCDQLLCGWKTTWESWASFQGPPSLCY